MALQKVLDLLSCPVCRKKVAYDQEGMQILCQACDERYPVKNGVPVMFTGEDGRDVKDLLQSPQGMEMIREFKKNGLLFKALNLGKRFVSSNLVLFDGKRLLEELIREKGENRRVLEIGAGNRRLNPDVINLDIEHFENTDVIGDARRLPFLDESFDLVWIEVVLEHVRRPQEAVAEIHRVLKPGGHVFSVVPFIHPYHSYPGDYSRFSLEGLEDLFSRFTRKKSGVYRGPSAALVNFLSDYFSLFSFSTDRRIYLLLKAMALCFLFPLKLLDRILVRNPRAHELAHCLFFLGKKESG